MPHKIDKRNFDFRRLGAGAIDVLRKNNFNMESAFDLAEAAAVRVEGFTGSASRILTSISPDDARSILTKAVELARGPALAVAGFAESTKTEIAEFAPILDTQHVSGSEVVHLQQTRLGIPVFASGRTVQFSGETAEISGTAVEAMDEVESEIALNDPREAVLIAAQFVAQPVESEDNGWGGTESAPAINLEKFAPRQIALFALPGRPTVFSGNPFVGTIKAQLAYFYQGPMARIAWQIELSIPDEQGDPAYDYVVMVAAGKHEPGEILYVQDQMCRLGGRCEVHVHNPAETPLPLSQVDLPRTATYYPPTLRPFASGGDWLDVQATQGNTVVCQGDGGAFRGTLNGNRVDFQPTTDMEKWTVQTFYFCNVMADFFRTLGFDEAAGNFQQRNPGGAPGSGDPVLARVFGNSFTGIASMATPPDGQSPIMKMGPHRVTGNHSALDSDVVFHEYVHGVSNRLVGGRLNHLALQDPQSRGMGEGWSDFFAITFQNAVRGVDRTVTGDWLKGVPVGIRGFPYTDAFPDTYGAVGTGRYLGEHQIGEIWCAALMKATRDLIAVLANRQRGFAIAWQAVIDGMRISPANPSFLDARDAIVAAIGNLARGGMITAAERVDTLRSFWGAFAHFGMGANASSPSSGLTGIREDSTMPQIA
jgi:extracellular elastinolytic metalloproteinase